MREVVLVPPPSKSDAQRALVLADIVGVPAPPGAEPGPDSSSDVEVVRNGLDVLRRGGGEVDCHDGGAPFRFLLTQAAVTPGAVTRFTGTKRLGERPHRPLVDSLRAALGPRGLVLEEGAPWPLVVRAPAGLAATHFEVSGAESSQFASSLLLGAARLAARTRSSVEVLARGALASEGYLALTVRWLERAGFEVRKEPGGDELRLVVSPPASVAALPAVPGDWSSLTIVLPLAWKSGARVAGVERETGHPDEAVVRHMEAVGLRLVHDDGRRSSRAAGPSSPSTSPGPGSDEPSREARGSSVPSARLPSNAAVDFARGEGDAHSGALVRVTGTLRGGLSVDAAASPDAVPALVALACALPERSTFTNTGVLRVKESDRVAGLADLAERVGATARLDGASLTITPGPATAGFDFDAHGDHRLAMAAALASVLTGADLRTLIGAASVKKSFPGFWREASKVQPAFGRFLEA